MLYIELNRSDMLCETIMPFPFQTVFITTHITQGFRSMLLININLELISTTNEASDRNLSSFLLPFETTLHGLDRQLFTWSAFIIIIIGKWFSFRRNHSIEWFYFILFSSFKRRSLVSIDSCSLDFCPSLSLVRYSLFFGWTFGTWLTFRFQWQVQGGKVTLIFLRLKMEERMGSASCAAETTRTELVFIVISWSISNECKVENTTRYLGRKLKGTSHRRFLQRLKNQMYSRHRIKRNKIKWMPWSRRTCWLNAISPSVSSRIVRSVNSWRSVVENGNQFHQNLSKLI